MFKFKTYCPLTTATTERHHKQWMLKATGENHLQSLKIFYVLRKFVYCSQIRFS